MEVDDWRNTQSLIDMPVTKEQSLKIVYSFTRKIEGNKYIGFEDRNQYLEEFLKELIKN
jgi:hypothetical protein